MTDDSIGLCATCVHKQIVTSDRQSQFVRCSLSKTDPIFPKYPRLPVVECTGWSTADNRDVLSTIRP